MADQTFPLTVSGREIQFRPPTDAQVLIVGRLMRKAQELDELAKNPEATDEEARPLVSRVSKILDIIDSMVVNPADRDWLETRMVEGKLDLSELMGAFKSDTAVAGNRATKRAVKKTARARTK